jgi:hypothetical protein
MTVGLTSSTATPGLKSGTVTIDNTDLSSGGAGQGSVDGDDVVNISASVLDNRTITSTPAVFGSVIVGYIGSIQTTLSTSGDDNTFTRVTVLGNGVAADANGVSLDAAGSALFDTNGETALRSVSAYFSTPGRKFGTIQLSRSGEGLAGEAVKAVTISYGAIVRPHSEASFSAAANIDSMTLDLGTVEPGTTPFEGQFSLFNIAGPGAAGLDLKAISASGDLGALRIDTADFAGLIGDEAGLFTALLDRTSPGAFSATYHIFVGDESLPGARDGQVLTLNLVGTVVPEPAAALLLLPIATYTRRRRI